MNNFNFHTDPGHGWLEVSLAQLKNVGMKPTDFSRYSYKDDRSNFYLEEDCDAPKFLAAHRAQHGEPVVREIHKDGSHRIRAMKSIKA